MRHTLPAGGVVPLPVTIYDYLAEKGAIANALPILAVWLCSTANMPRTANQQSAPGGTASAFDAMCAAFAVGESWQDAMDHPASASADGTATDTRADARVNSISTEAGHV